MISARPNDAFLASDVSGLGDFRGSAAVEPAIVRSQPLAGPGYGSAVLPSQASLELVNKGPITDRLLIKKLDLGSAQIDLGDGYSVSLNDRDRMVVVENALIGSRTVIFGDGRIETPTGEPLQFWGTTSLSFGNDAKLTLETIADPETQGAFKLDRLTLTNGNKAAIITGLTDTIEGDISIKTASGYATDERIRDGFMLEEEADGSGWLDESGDAITQALLNATAIGGEYAPGSTALSRGEWHALISRFFFTTLSFNFLSQSLSQSLSRAQNSYSDQSHDDRRSSDRMRMDRMAAEQVRYYQAHAQRRLENMR